MSRRIIQSMLKDTVEQDFRNGNLGMIDFMGVHKTIANTFSLEELQDLRQLLSIAIKQEKCIIEKGAMHDCLAYINERIVLKMKPQQ